MNGDLSALATQLRATGASWGEVLGRLQERGGARLDLVRAVRDSERLSLVEATKIVNDSGVMPSVEFAVTVNQDPFRGGFFSDESEGKPDEGSRSRTQRR